MEDSKMTRYAFISHIEDFMGKLLRDPLHADTDDFLKSHGIDSEKALTYLLYRKDPSDPNSAIMTRKLSIKNNGVDDNGKKLKDSFTVKYMFPRKGYDRKIRDLYISLFESNIVNESLLNEGAWGYGILQNDSALDMQSDFGKKCLAELYNKLIATEDNDDRWATVGVFVDFVKKYKDNELHFTDEYNKSLELLRQNISILYNDDSFIQGWNDPKAMKSELKKISKELSEMKYEKEIMNTEKEKSTSPTGLKINEDGEGGGATSCDSSSGQYVQPLFGKPIARTLYLTTEQLEAIGKKLNEEAVMDTMAGDFGFDVPIGDGKNNKNNEFYKEANDHKSMMEKSWQGEI